MISAIPRSYSSLAILDGLELFKEAERKKRKFFFSYKGVCVFSSPNEIEIALHFKKLRR